VRGNIADCRFAIQQAAGDRKWQIGKGEVWVPGRLASDLTSAEQVSTESGSDRVNDHLYGHCPLIRPGLYLSRYGPAGPADLKDPVTRLTDPPGKFSIACSRQCTENTLRMGNYMTDQDSARSF
jgi:hypothetical protein